MNPFIIQKASAANFEAISNLILNQNKNPETHCINSETGNDAHSILSEMIRLDSDSGICFMLALQTGEMMGALGCELDEEMGRGWMRGPFIVSKSDEWEAVASALFQKLQESLPSSIRCLDSFLNISNERGHQFYLARGFQQLRLVHVYVTAAFDPSLKTGLNICAALDPFQAKNFAALHNSIFPQTYATGQRILDKLDDHHQIFVYTQNDVLLGYLYAVIEEETGEGSVEFIGVREDARGKGIGRQLLKTALQWLFESQKAPQVTLVVNDNLTNARSLYESVGFQLRYTGVHTRKKWPADG